MSLLGGCLLSQILVLVQRVCLKINFHTSSHNPDNLRLQPPRFGLLKPSAVVSSYIGAAQFVVYRVSTPKVGGSREDSRLFFLVEIPNSFQPAYAASLCSLVGKGLCEPITTLASGRSCKPDSHSPTSSNYFVVSFVHCSRSLCPTPAVVSSFYRCCAVGVLLSNPRNRR